MRVIFLSLFFLLNSIYALEYRPYFIGGQYSKGLSSFYSSCGDKDSIGDGYGFKAGIRDESYRLYTAYDSISWDDASADIISFNLDYIIPLFESKKRVSLNMYRMLSIYFGVNFSKISFEALNSSDSEFNFIDPLELFGTNTIISNLGWQFGFIYDFNSDFNAEVSYRFFPASLKVGNNRYIKMDNLHLLSLGLSYKFGGKIEDFKEVKEIKPVIREVKPKLKPLRKLSTIKPILPLPAPIIVKPIPKIVLPKRAVRSKKCENPPSCTVLDSNNCPLKITLNVLFARDSYIFNEKYDEDLEMVKKILEDNKNLKVIIQGFTDSKNTDKYNLKLSQNRAKSIVDRLILLGASSSRIIGHGYGENYPIASNDTKEGRALNRRVEAEFYEDKFYEDGGCKLRDMILKVNFDRNSAYLKKRYDEEILKVAKVLSIREDLRVNISGYTDSKNSETYNLKLSKKRALAVKNRLIDFGISKSRINSFGFGESKPIATNETKEGRAINRRVEVKFIKE